MNRLLIAGGDDLPDKAQQLAARVIHRNVFHVLTSKQK
jgi:hypothetical protein